MSVSFSLHFTDTTELHNNHAFETQSDFESESRVRAGVTRFFSNYACPSCGGHKIDGGGIIVKYGKVKLYREEQKKGFFGGISYENKLWKTTYRVQDIQLENGGFLSSAGYLKCRDCKWRIEGGSSSTQWLSINDIIGR